MITGLLSSSSSNKPEVPSTTAFVVFGIEIALLLLRSFAIALLSYRKYGSLGWAFLVFLFPDVYILYYVFFLNGGMVGGRR